MWLGERKKVHLLIYMREKKIRVCAKIRVAESVRPAYQPASYSDLCKSLTVAYNNSYLEMCKKKKKEREQKKKKRREK